MRTLSLVQGSDEWLETRMSHFTASECPAMMGKSKYQKRDELLHMKKTGMQKKVDDFTQKIFAKGHEAEALARPIAEKIVGQELFSSTGAIDIDGLPLLASFDGITMDETIIWEHKLWNESLAQSIRGGKIDQHYLWQIGQQMLVSNADKCLFMTSDGTEENCEHCWITINGEFGKHILPIYMPKGLGGLGDSWKDELITGWLMFKDDLATYIPPVEATADQELQDLYDTYAEAKEELDRVNQMVKALESDIKNKAESLGAKTITGHNFKVSLVERKGTIDYKAIPELKGVDTEAYRKAASTYYTIKQA